MEILYIFIGLWTAYAGVHALAAYEEWRYLRLANIVNREAKKWLETQNLN